jgi:hypothetical protein
LEYSLYLYALQAPALAAEALLEKLEQIKFIAPGDSSRIYSPGANLMDYITFLGCSPALQRGEIESVIRLHRASSAFAMGGESVQTLRYPGCKHPIENVSEIICHFDQRWHCPQCDNTGEFSSINWRKSAAISRLFIEITRVFPKEAVPSDKLLSFLQQTSATDWSWFYSRSQ